MPILLLAANISLAAADSLPMDRPVMVDGVETVCTGVSLDAREDPRWSGYSLKVEIAGSGGRYLGEESVSVTSQGRQILSVDCGGPWLLFRLPAGRYEVNAAIGGEHATSAAFVADGVQGRIILRFSEVNKDYSMNYTDEAAAALGVHNGRVDALSISPGPDHGIVPSVRAGVDRRGASLNLQWKTN